MLPYWPTRQGSLVRRDVPAAADGGPPSLGSACGIPGLAGIVPFAGAGALTAWSIVRVVVLDALDAVVVAIVSSRVAVPHGGHDAERAYTQTLHPVVAR